MNKYLLLATPCKIMEWQEFLFIYESGIILGALISMCVPSIQPITPGNDDIPLKCISDSTISGTEGKCIKVQESLATAGTASLKANHNVDLDTSKRSATDLRKEKAIP